MNVATPGRTYEEILVCSAGAYESHGILCEKGPPPSYRVVREHHHTLRNPTATVFWGPNVFTIVKSVFRLFRTSCAYSGRNCHSFSIAHHRRKASHTNLRMSKGKKLVSSRSCCWGRIALIKTFRSISTSFQIDHDSRFMHQHAELTKVLLPWCIPPNTQRSVP